MLMAETDGNDQSHAASEQQPVTIKGKSLDSLVAYFLSRSLSALYCSLGDTEKALVQTIAVEAAQTLYGFLGELGTYSLINGQAQREFEKRVGQKLGFESDDSSDARAIPYATRRLASELSITDKRTATSLIWTPVLHIAKFANTSNSSCPDLGAYTRERKRDWRNSRPGLPGRELHTNHWEGGPPSRRYTTLRGRDE